MQYIALIDKMGSIVERNARILVAGHRGLVGSALCRRLRATGYAHVLTADRGELACGDLFPQRTARSAVE